MTVREQVLAAALKVRKQLAGVTMVVSNAGTYIAGPLAGLRPESVLHLLDVNLMAHMWVSNYVFTILTGYCILKTMDWKYILLSHE